MVECLGLKPCAEEEHQKSNAERVSLREELMSRLEKARDHLRLIVSPPGHGKSILALAYANRFFSFKDVVWIEGDNLCQIDEQYISSMIAQYGTQAGLFVIDNLPEIDPHLGKGLLRHIGVLMQNGWEVVLCLDPANDFISKTPFPLLRVTPRDLYSQETEYDVSQRQRGKEEAIYITKESNRTLEKVIHEGLPNTVALILFSMLIMEKGRPEDILLFLDEPKRQFDFENLSSFSEIGITCTKSSFEAQSHPIETLSKIFSPLLPRISLCSSFPTNDAFIARLADVLLGTNRPDRACDVIRLFVGEELKSAWLQKRSDSLYEKGCFLSPLSLFKSLEAPKPLFNSDVLLVASRCLYFLGNKTGALALAEKVLKSNKTADEGYMEAALIVIKLAGRKRRNDVLNQLKRVTSSRGLFFEDEEIFSYSFTSQHAFELGIKANLEFCLQSNPDVLLKFLKNCLKQKMSETSITRLFVRVVDKALDEKNLHSKEHVVLRYIDPLIELAFEFLLSTEKPDEFTYSKALLVKGLEQLQTFVTKEFYSLLPLKMREMTHKMDVEVFSQKRRYEKYFQEEERKDYGMRSKTTSVLDKKEDETNEVPTISLQLLGNFCVKSDERELDPVSFKRQKTKSLLVLLALNQGKEIPRDRLARILWPESQPQTAHKNLHSTWSILRKALKTPQGSCPYLTTTLYSYKLEDEYVVSDVAKFSSLSKKVLFDTQEGIDWVSINAKIVSLYQGDLFPTERDVEVIIKAREELKSRFVECCTRSASRLFERAEYEKAMWFSQIAIDHDSTREDAYLSLMKSQVSLGQRTAALDTYFHCCKQLSEQLGIDPGKHTKTLYQEIIMEEAPLLQTQSNNGIDGL